MTKILGLARIPIVEAVRSRWLPALCSLVVMISLVFFAVKVRDGSLHDSPEATISWLANVVFGLGVLTGFLAAWTNAGSWYDSGVRAGSLVFMALRPLPRRELLLGSWLGLLATSCAQIFVGLLGLTCVALVTRTSLSGLWVGALALVPAVAMWTAAFTVGSLFLSRATTGAILLLLMVGESFAPIMVRSVGGRLGTLFLYLQPPLLPTWILDEASRGGETAPWAVIVYQLCATLLLLQAGMRRFERVELVPR